MAERVRARIERAEYGYAKLLNVTTDSVCEEEKSKCMNPPTLTYEHPNYEYRLSKKARFIVTNTTPEEIKSDLVRIRQIHGDTEADDLTKLCRMWWRQQQ